MTATGRAGRLGDARGRRNRPSARRSPNALDPRVARPRARGRSARCASPGEVTAWRHAAARELVHERLDGRIGAIDRLHGRGTIAAGRASSVRADDRSSRASCSAATPGRRSSSSCPAGWRAAPRPSGARRSRAGWPRSRAAGAGRCSCGYSIGGRLALHAALRDPGRYRAVVMIGAAAGIEERGRARARARGRRAAGRLDGDDADRGDRGPCGSASRCSPTSRDGTGGGQRPGRLTHDPRSLALLLRSAGQGRLEPVWQSWSASSCRSWLLAGSPRRPLRAGAGADGPAGARGALGPRGERRPRGAPAAARGVAALLASSRRER